jgi:hypothetical protein
VLPPWQRLVLPLTEIVGVATTVTVTVFCELHPDVVPVTVYTVVLLGDAVGLEQVVQLSPVLFAQE